MHSFISSFISKYLFCSYLSPSSAFGNRDTAVNKAVQPLFQEAYVKSVK